MFMEHGSVHEYLRTVKHFYYEDSIALKYNKNKGELSTYNEGGSREEGGLVSIILCGTSLVWAPLEQ